MAEMSSVGVQSPPRDTRGGSGRQGGDHEGQRREREVECIADIARMGDGCDGCRVYLYIFSGGALGKWTRKSRRCWVYGWTRSCVSTTKP